jgi:Signal transduction histidine kinase
MKYRTDDLEGIRKARFASFVLLLISFAAMVVFLVLFVGTIPAYIAAACIIAILVICWWFIYRKILFDESKLFETYWNEIRAINSRLRTLESAVRQIGDGVIIIANDGDFVLINETIKNLFAAYDGELDGPLYDEHASGFSEKLERSAILSAANNGHPPETINVAGQTYKIGYVSLAAEKGLGKGAVAVVSDVTESTKTELMQREFVTNVTHELKTPLTNVKAYAETLLSLDANDAKAIRDYLEIIVSESDRMDRLIKDLLDLTGRMKMETDDSDLTLLVRMSIKKIDMSAKKKMLSVNQMFADEPRYYVEMDRNRIEQVISNILGNAMKYTGEKGRIDVDIIPGQNCVQIVISDNGVGIPEDDLPRVFERFYRVEKSRTEGPDGTGLGLAISKQIVDAHNGTINLESKVGRGTTVTISLPLAKTRGTPGIL